MIHTHEPSLLCPVCNRGFRAERTLKIHMYLHTGKRPHSCTICGKTFGAAYNKKMCLIRHHKKGETEENFPQEEKDLIKKREDERIKLAQIKNALVAKVGNQAKKELIPVKKAKTIEEESSNAVASIQGEYVMADYGENLETHYEEYILEDNVEQEGEIIEEKPDTDKEENEA